MVITDELAGTSFGLADTVTCDLARFIDELALDPAISEKEISIIVSTLLAEQLSLNRDAWLNVFKQGLRSA